MDRTGVNRVRLGWVGLGWTELDGLGWVDWLDRAGPGWVGLDWIGPD